MDLHNVYGVGDPAQAELERELTDRADLVLVCSDLERQRLLSVLGPDSSALAQDRVRVLPHGIDPAEWQAEPDPSPTPVVRLFGSWGWRPNGEGLRWFLDRVWPSVHAAEPTIRCEVAGTGPVGDLPAGAYAVGRVADLAAWLAQAWLVAVPVRDGLGAPVKLAEALATGVPVIATTEAASAQRWAPGYVGDTPEEWTRWILETVRRPTEARRDARSSRRAVLADGTWARVAASLVTWVDLAEARRAHPPSDADERLIRGS